MPTTYPTIPLRWKSSQSLLEIIESERAGRETSLPSRVRYNPLHCDHSRWTLGEISSNLVELEYHSHLTLDFSMEELGRSWAKDPRVNLVMEPHGRDEDVIDIFPSIGVPWSPNLLGPSEIREAHQNGVWDELATDQCAVHLLNSGSYFDGTGDWADTFPCPGGTWAQVKISWWGILAMRFIAHGEKDWVAWLDLASLTIHGRKL